jgi:hypothetical protein
MKTPTTPLKFTTLYGPLYIAVLAANAHSYHDTERGNVTDLRPSLRVASSSAFEAEPARADHWTIRRRPYGVHWEIFHEDRTALGGDRWHRTAPYRGGFRADHGGPVETQTKTFDLMWEETVRALDTFDAQNEGWRDLSVHLLHQQRADAAFVKEHNAYREAEKYLAEGQAHEKESNAVYATLPEAIAQLIITSEDD